MGSPEMGAEDDPGPMIDQVRDGGEAGPDPGVVFDRSVRIHGHIEVDPHEHPLSADILIPHRLLLHGSVS